MPRDVIVVGGSAGALMPLTQMLRTLPSSLPASMLVVIHTSPDAPGTLPQLFQRCAMTVAYAQDDDELRPGHVYIAPPDRHLLLDDHRMILTRGPRENGFRPAVDPLFRTAAIHHGPRVIGIVLSGGLDDGTHGLARIKEHRGIAVVQHAEEALADGMPLSAIRHVAVDHIVRSPEMAALILRLINEPLEAKEPTITKKRAKPDRAERGLHTLEDATFDGQPSVFTCPECNGPLWERSDGKLLRFVCHVGHSYSPDALVDGKMDALEGALWTALRALEENAAFLRRLQDRAYAQGLHTIAEGYGVKAKELEGRAEIVRAALVDEPPPPHHEPVDDPHQQGSEARARAGGIA